MPGKQAVDERMQAASQLLETARALSPIQSALIAVFKPQFDIPEDILKLAERLQ